MNSSATAKEPDDIELKVLVDQAKAFDSSLVVGRLGSSAVALLVAWLFRDSGQHAYIWLWFGTLVVFNIISPYYWFAQGRANLDVSNAQWRLRAITVSSLISGLLWVAGVFLLWIPGNFEAQMLVIFTIFGVASVSLPALNAHLPAFYCFFLPCVSSVPLISLWYYDKYSDTVAIAFAFVLLLNSLLAIKMHRSLVDSIRKHYVAVKLAKELQKQKEIAEAAVHLKSRFLAAASHDLRQPMHAMNLYLGGLAYANLQPEARAILNNARVCADNMDKMFSALLDLSQLDASVIEAKFSNFPIAVILNKIKVEFSNQAQAKGLILRVAPCSAHVHADLHLLENIVRNFVSNALRYTQCGKVLLCCRRCAAGLRIAVYDTGIGIDLEEQGKIFEEYYQVGNHQRDSARGLGLGLAIVQRQARIMGTAITVVSEPGRGSMFSITVQTSHESVAEIAQANQMPELHADSLHGVFIAIIDDEELILNASSLLLSKWGCTVLTANSGEAMLAQLASIERAPDLIICDHRLHGTATGMDVISSLRHEFNREIPALLITGDTSPDKVKLLMSTGLPVLHKPLQGHALHAAVHKLVNAGAKNAHQENY